MRCSTPSLLALGLVACGHGGAASTSDGAVATAGRGAATTTITTTTTATTTATTVAATTTTTPAASTTLPPADDCARVAARVELSHPGATQVVVVLTATASATEATLQLATRSAQGWLCAPAMAARVGRAGVRPLLERRSGDGTTPAGVFPLGTMTAWDGQVFSFFGNAPDPGVTAGTYRAVREGDCFGAMPNHPDYGHLVQRPKAQCPGPDDEYLPSFPKAYEHAALIGANTEPDVSGDAPGEPPYAAAIFLHRFTYDAAGRPKPTSGCVSMAHDDLVAALTWMRPGVLFAIGTRDWLLADA